jgi:hypothetical protein
MGQNVHIVPDDGGWSVKHEGVSKPISFHRLQEDAIDMGRDVAGRECVELVIHDDDGRIRDVDPCEGDPEARKNVVG